MALDLTVFAADRDALIADSPSTLTYNAVNYTCRKTMLTKELKYGEYGVSEGYDFSVRMKRSDANAIPNRAVVSVDSISFRVLSRDNDRFGLSTILHLGDQYA